MKYIITIINCTAEWCNVPCALVESTPRHLHFDTRLLVKPKVLHRPFHIRVFELETILPQELGEEFVYLGQRNLRIRVIISS